LSDNRVAGDQIELEYGRAQLADKNAGTGKVVTVTDVRVSGADAGNYAVTRVVTAQADIAPAQLNITATGLDRVYDGSLNASVSLSDNRRGNDQFEFIFAQPTYADKNAGSAKTITVTGITLSGADALNYLWNTTVSAQSTVAPAVLPLSVIVVPKVYDGTLTAGVQLRDGRVAGDDITIDIGNASFVDPTQGVNKRVVVENVRISGGADRGNYVLASDQVFGIGNIRSLAETAGSAEPATLVPVMPQPTVAAVLPLQAAVLDLTTPRGFAGLQARPGQQISQAQALASAAAANSDAAAPEAGSQAGSEPGSQAGSQASSEAGSQASSKAANVSRGDVAVAQEQGDGLSVTLVRDPEGRSAGLVSVLVPKSLLESGKSFGFPMPAELAALPGFDKAQLSMADGSPMPKWLAYNAAARSFSVSAVPAGALPVQLAVRIAGQRWALTLSER
jgi:hypothetical protein